MTSVKEQLAMCCGSKRWVEAIAEKWPFESKDSLFSYAKEAWRGLSEKDWKEAFTHHPKIGENVEELRKKFQKTADWAGEEQSSVGEATEETLQKLAEGNKKYFETFGFIFIVCATGKSAAEMLTLLEERLQNDPAEEIHIAASEQEKITRIRLEKLSASVKKPGR